MRVIFVREYTFVNRIYAGCRISEIKEQIEELLRQKNILEKALNQKIKEKKI